MNLVPHHIIDRTGPRTFADLSAEVLDLLNKGQIETTNLNEWLKIDQFELLTQVLKELKREQHYSLFTEQLFELERPTSHAQARCIGTVFGLNFEDTEVYEYLQNHSSDMVRCWSCWAESLQHDDMISLLHSMKPYAGDTHFAVREVVLFVCKKRLSKELTHSIDLLIDWTESKDENIRRFAVEVIRPIGVWTKKIETLQSAPEMAIPLLSKLMNDESRYVQNAVANWLNDASKTRPEWVERFCAGWQMRSPTKATNFIVKRALRTIKKNRT